MTDQEADDGYSDVGYGAGSKPDGDMYDYVTPPLVPQPHDNNFRGSSTFGNTEHAYDWIDR